MYLVYKLCSPELEENNNACLPACMHARFCNDMFLFLSRDFQMEYGALVRYFGLRYDLPYGL